MKKQKPRLSRALRKALSNSSAAIQRTRLIAHLTNHQSITTIEAREHLNILAPAPRIYELRHDHGYNIITEWINDTTAQGYKHRVARYVLLPGKWKTGVKLCKAA